jgi:hypothetical protein
MLYSTAWQAGQLRRARLPGREYFSDPDAR